jgi:hypothetical protein
MTPRMGILQWVSNTLPLKSAVEGVLAQDATFMQSYKQGPDVRGQTPQQRCSVHLMLVPAAAHYRAKYLRDKTDAPQFHRQCKLVKREEAAAVLAQCEAMTPADCLRRQVVCCAVVVLRISLFYTVTYY